MIMEGIVMLSGHHPLTRPAPEPAAPPSAPPSGEGAAELKEVRAAALPAGSTVGCVADASPESIAGQDSSPAHTPGREHRLAAPPSAAPPSPSPSDPSPDDGAARPVESLPSLGGIVLLQVKRYAATPLGVCARQVPARPYYLDSRDAFVLLHAPRRQLYLWWGEHSDTTND